MNTPTPKTPNLIVKSIFFQLHKETAFKILTEKFKEIEYLMFPFLHTQNDGMILGWLCFSEPKENFSKMEYFPGFKPYRIFKKDEIPFNKPSLILTGGYTRCGEITTEEEGFPNVRIQIINGDHAFSSGADLREIISLNKLIKKLIALNSKFD